MQLLAHSARLKSKIPAQPYATHVRAVSSLAYKSALEIIKYRGNDELANLVRLSACWHDLGKIDPENQRVLHGVRRESLPVQHEYAGVRYLRDRGHGLAAALVYSHHRGLPNFSLQLYEEVPFEDFDESALSRVEAFMDDLVKGHLADFPDCENPEIGGANWKKAARSFSGLAWRFALSCLVDGDHSDTAQNYGGESEVRPLDGRWPERTEALERYVRDLAKDSKASQGRNRLRGAVYEGCRDLEAADRRYACDSGVGTGKTTAVMAHLLRVAKERSLRHIFVVLPFTNIINQSVDTYRKALTLEGEDPEQVVAAHHHQVDFESPELRQLATLWNCPIVVTTAVQFFQTIAASKPGVLRKLHELPGSAVFIDEAHAALPAWLWPQTWRWIEELTKDWGCHFVFASGSLVRFWEQEDFVRPPERIPEILPADIRDATESGERRRIQFEREKRRLTFEELIGVVFAEPNSGPSLIVVNTVQTAAALAIAMRKAGNDVLHLSTALAPQDRDPIIKKIKARLGDELDSNWALVATSCVEAGLDFDFRTAFRELSSVTSVIQIGGRVNRNANRQSGRVLVFSFDDARASQNPALKISMRVLESLFESGDMQRLTASEVCTKALQRELNEASHEKLMQISQLEGKIDFPGVSAEYRVIEDETVAVLVPPTLGAFESGQRLSPVEVVQGSVRLRKRAASKYAVRGLAGGSELYGWTLDYDSRFLGYMSGVLAANSVIAGDFTSA